ncbi:hypothetical protein BCV70DRAFT_198047 [Testicularia cyperi]|uniref:Uncharacterized protein n=1 Tax=Testicularia cyperi TaxID=1882483 RepID=A0A317Y0F9_9BASI|nr:hypothetical protein BCV70DRAFT_198047 [Testicularia cyperi]
MVIAPPPRRSLGHESAASFASSSSSTSPTKSRICKKLVLKGQAGAHGASYTLYLRAELPSHDTPSASYPLITETGIELEDALVHRLDASGAAPALSASAAAAASSLGIPLSVNHDLSTSFIDIPTTSSAHPPGVRRASSAFTSIEHPDDEGDLPRVIVQNNGCISLVTTERSQPISSSSSPPKSSSFMITLHLRVNLLSSPPLAPYTIRLPKPFCLNNYMRFTADETICGSSREIAVEVDPPVHARDTAPAETLRSPTQLSQPPSDDVDITILEPPSDDSDQDDYSAVITGHFQSCDAVTIRLAPNDAGDLNVPDVAHDNIVLACALQAKSASSTINYKPLPTHLGKAEGLDPRLEAFEFDATVVLHRPFYPGLEHEICLYLQLRSPIPGHADWIPGAVDASHGILSWGMGSIPLASPDRADEHANAPSKSFATSSATENLIWPDANLTAEEENLINVAPPKDLDDTAFDFSVDRGEPTTFKQRRFSLPSSSSGPSDSSSALSRDNGVGSKEEGLIARPDLLIVVFNVLPLTQSTEPLTLNIRGMVGISKTIGDGQSSFPVVSIPSVANVSPPEIHLVTEAGKVEADITAEDPNASILTIPANRSLQQQPATSPPIVPIPTQEIVDRVLKLIQAHDVVVSQDQLQKSLPSALSDESATREVAADVHRTGGFLGQSGVVFRVSHLLWTLALTYMLFMMFNASQVADQALLHKIDELTRIIETRLADHSIPLQASVASPLDQFSPAAQSQTTSFTSADNGQGPSDSDEEDLRANMPLWYEAQSDLSSYSDATADHNAPIMSQATPQTGLVSSVTSLVVTTLSLPLLILRQIVRSLFGG